MQLPGTLRRVRPYPELSETDARLIAATFQQLLRGTDLLDRDRLAYLVGCTADIVGEALERKLLNEAAPRR